jgi:hypothetical protein
MTRGKVSWIWIESPEVIFPLLPFLLPIARQFPHPLIPSLNSPGAWSFWSEDKRTCSVDHTRYFLLHLAHPRAPQHRGGRLRISIKRAERF